MASESAADLERLIAAEHRHPVSPAAAALTSAILDRHPGAVAGILFYGSCLRRNVGEGVHDFYVLVDSYDTAYESTRLRILNKLLPPNVFYLEAQENGETVRAKYAVISLDDFSHATGRGCLSPYIWARFAQPSLLVHVRDESTRTRIVRDLAQAATTLVERLFVFLPAHGDQQRFTLSALWQEAFRRTYTSELRGEQPTTIRQIYEDNAERYHAVARSALRRLRDNAVILRVTERGDAVEVRVHRATRLQGQLRWHLTRPLSKTITFVRLLKSATTFGDWIPYILWKVERHSGERVEVSERQRRHPFLFGWPVLFRLVRRGHLR